MTAPSLRRKTERMDVRVPEEIKTVIHRAAELSGRSTSEFVISSALAAAEETLAKHSLHYLSVRDSERFYAALANPPEPSEPMRKLARKHAEIVEVVW